jgi:hypothetical protein
MMVTGIVLTSLSPVAFLLGAAGMISSRPALFAGGYLTGFALAGAGIPLIVVGARRKPIGTGYVAPWVAPRSGGLQLGLAL